MTLTKVFPSLSTSPLLLLSPFFTTTLLEYILFWKLLRGFKFTVETEVKAIASSAFKYSTHAREKKI